MARRARKHVPLKTKLAAALLALGHIDYEESKAMTAGQIISRYDFDHWPILHALGGQDVPWNLRPLLRAKHREKSSKDTTAVAKVKRIEAARCKHCGGNGVGCCAGAFSEAFNRKQARPAPRKATGGFSRSPSRTLWPKRKMASRPFPGAKPRSPGNSCWKATPPRDVNHE